MKNIPVYKFLLPLSSILLLIGGALFFLGFFPIFGIGSEFGFTMEVVVVLSLVFGFAFLVISLIDRSISRRRAIQMGQADIEPGKLFRILKAMGVLIVCIVVLFWLFLFFIVSNMWG